MIPQRYGLSLQTPLNTLILLVHHLVLPQSCTGQSQLMGPSQPIVAAVGDDVVLPCYLEPAVDVAAMTLEWTRSDLDPIFVHVWRNGQDLSDAKNPSYKDRTSLSVDEVKRGNISLKLSDVKPSDQGTYQCYIPKLDKGSSVQLVVGSVALAMVDIAGMDRNKGGVMLNCESKGWYPEPEVLWLDGEGNLLSAGPAETVRGPDDLYTVSSRVTVEKRHSNRFTCRVQQKDINQTREAHIHVPGVFFEVQSSSSSSSSVISGLAVFLAVCILIILLLVFFVWRQKKNKTKKGEEDKERENLMVDHLNAKIKKLEEEKKESEETLQKQVDGLNAEVKKLTEEKGKSENERQKLQTELEMKTNQLLEEKREAQEEIDSLKKLLESKYTEGGGLAAYVQKLKEDLEGKKKELEDQKQTADRKWSQTNEELMEAKTELRIKEREVKRLTDDLKEEKKKSQNLQTELNIKEKEVGGLTVYVQKLEKDLETKKKQLEDQKQTADRKWSQTNEELMEAKTEQRIKEREVGRLTDELKEEKKQRGDERQKLHKQVDGLNAEVKKLTEEKWKSENERQKLQTELEMKTNQVDHLNAKIKKLEEEKKESEETLQKQVDGLNAEVKKLTEEKGKSENEQQKLQTELEMKTNQVGGLTASVQKLEKDLETKKKEGRRLLETFPAVSGREARYTLDWKPHKERQHEGSSSDDRPVIEVDDLRQCIHLRNSSDQDQQLGGWMLKLQVNNKEPVSFTFDPSIILKAGNFVKLWGPGYGYHDPPTDLLWRDLKTWSTKDHLQIFLYSNTGEIKS